MALIAINFNDGQIEMFLNLRNLRHYFPDHETSNVVVRLRDWSHPNREIEEESYYFIGELINAHLEVSLYNFNT